MMMPEHKRKKRKAAQKALSESYQENDSLWASNHELQFHQANHGLVSDLRGLNGKGMSDGIREMTYSDRRVRVDLSSM